MQKIMKPAIINKDIKRISALYSKTDEGINEQVGSEKKK